MSAGCVCVCHGTVDRTVDCTVKTCMPRYASCASGYFGSPESLSHYIAGIAL